MKTVHGVVVEFGRGGVEWGFLREDGNSSVKDTFVHRKNFSPGVHSLTRWERVEWIEATGERGLYAVELKLEQAPMQELPVADRSDKSGRSH
jgi:cold shock CspA family protein